jgi:hypothetical protein
MGPFKQLALGAHPTLAISRPLSLSGLSVSPSDDDGHQQVEHEDGDKDEVDEQHDAAKDALMGGGRMREKE